MSYAKLRGKIKEVFGAQWKFAKEMEMDPATLSLKLNGHSEWTKGEIERACLLLNIPFEEIPDYFFSPKVAITQSSI